MRRREDDAGGMPASKRTRLTPWRSFAIDAAHPAQRSLTANTTASAFLSARFGARLHARTLLG
jgi:hypothetical protein